MKTLIFILFSFILVPSVFAQQTDITKYSIEKDSIYADSIPPHKVRNIIGRATYYASKFHGRRTANGEIFNNRKMTAAHLKLPFGTFVTVTNLENGRSVEVRVNDRGPHTKTFIIDVSQAAAKELGFYGKGVAKVEICYQIPKNKSI
ncbi:MAG: septal ring lytic transglycosylase RlpA family protein [Daejeonella sp.]|uniref:septal ring lytic transglycosylase RlpA family protein n=1 Tax=Daejeonella sp. TaxID=2805397 RepID=UPI002733292A|nr:septal ring lytic transglycosylase RlpA family protein [Daejeonella sp.]MDP3467732.1 septal ring lytic transglycosylase RlpA family protein [Daejeonella sp.]